MENTKYTEEFKQSIVSLYESGKSSTQICKEYGMSSSTLHKWIKKYTKVQVSETETMTIAEIKKMQKKLALLEEENIIHISNFKPSPHCKLSHFKLYIFKRKQHAC